MPPIETITRGGSSEMPVNELTVVPRGCVVNAPGLCLRTVPFRACVVESLTLSTLKPAFSSLALAAASLRPTTLGTSLGPAEYTTVTRLPLDTLVAGRGSLSMTVPAFSSDCRFWSFTRRPASVSFCRAVSLSSPRMSGTTTSGGPVEVGVDGEALTMAPPLRFVIRPGALTVRQARAVLSRPVAAPAVHVVSASTLGALWDTALGRPVVSV